MYNPKDHLFMGAQSDTLNRPHCPCHLKQLMIIGGKMKKLSQGKVVMIIFFSFLGVMQPVLAGAQIYPTKPIHIVVGFPPGGGSDVMTRAVGEKLSSSLKQPVIVDNRPGAGGTIGAAIVARSAPDGYTLLLGQTANLAIAPALMSKVGFDPVKDFAPVIDLVTAPLVLVGPISLPAKTLKELIALAKAKPAGLNYASSGNGTTSHLAAELFKKQAGIDILHSPYKGQSPAILDILANRVSMYFSTIAVITPYITSGRMRAFAVTSPERTQALPEIPTLKEAGVPGCEADSWYGIFAPTGTSKEIIAKLNAELRKVLSLPDIRKQLMKEGGVIVGDSPEDFQRIVESDVLKWAKIVKEAGVRVD
jgi:tripartite-type tricarboxylate transporter receptor subunit TctC